MVKKSKKNVVGVWAFLIGVILAIGIGLFSEFLAATAYKTVLGVLVVLGIIIGLLNISTKENSQFLLAGLVLVVVGYMGQGILGIIPQLSKILSSLLILFVPATIIVALRTVFEVARN